MAILPYQKIRDLGHRRLVSPMVDRTHHESGMTYGLGPAGYDIRIAQTVAIPPTGFALASSIERFDLPWDLMMEICDKSSWARRGLSVFNSRAEPGWRGFLTIELANHSLQEIRIDAGSPIAHCVFHTLTEPTDHPYAGKYQDQGSGPQEAL